MVRGGGAEGRKDGMKRERKRAEERTSADLFFLGWGLAVHFALGAVKCFVLGNDHARTRTLVVTASETGKRGVAMGGNQKVINYPVVVQKEEERKEGRRRVLPTRPKSESKKKKEEAPTRDQTPDL